jgi:hypothetical protein
MRARRLFHPPGDARLPPGDARPAPHSAPPGLRRPDPLRTTKTAKRPAPPDPAARLHVPMRTSPTPPLAGERACPGRDPAAGVRWGLAANKTPHPEEAAKAAVSKGLPSRRRGPAPAKAGDAPAPIPVIPAQAAARGLDPRGRTHSPYAAATAPAPRFRGADQHCARAKTHPEN